MNRTRKEGPANRPFYLDFPFMGEAVDRKIRSIFLREGINLRIYRRTTSLKEILRPKYADNRRCIWPECPTRTNGLCFIRNVVYRLICLPCGEMYIGCTTRYLHERIRDHTHRGAGSSIHSHLSSCGVDGPNVRVTIISRHKDSINTRIAEAFAIRDQKPGLNGKDESQL